jgi:pSer/pThr/pTyr-binding forkhead associated (FHA) protein
MTRRLRIAQEGQEPVIFDVALVTIGRSASNMLVIKDTRVSSVHGEVVRRGTSFFYRDLGSTNGSMVRTAGRDVVVDGKQVREQLLGDGDALLLGDRYEPVVLSVAILEPEEDAAGSTLVGRRLVTTVDALGTQVVENPLANRQTLSRLLAFYGKIGGTTRPRALTDIVCQTMLELLSKTVFVAAFLKLDGKEERTSLITRDAAHTPLVTPEELHAWFPDAFRGEAAMVIGVPAAVKKRLGQLSQIAAAPLPGESGPLGVAVLGRAATFSDFDLDLLALVAHHGAIQLEKIGLIDKLSHANQHLAAENRDLRHKLDGGAEARPGRPGRAHRDHRARLGRDRYGQGAGRALHPRAQPPRRAGFRSGELRRPRRDPARE